MAASAQKVIEKIAELDTEMGWRPETRAEAAEKLAEWRAEAKSAVRAGVKRGSPSIYLDVDDWFAAIVDAFDTLGMKPASQVYLNYIFGQRGSAHATRKKSPAQLDREIAEALADRKRERGGHAARRVSGIGTLPAATMEQRLASMSTVDLMFAARSLAKKTDVASDRACTAVLDALEKRISPSAFESFTAEIYAQ
jgi:hypothetical protein